MQTELDRDFRVTVWSQDGFMPSTYPIDALEDVLDRSQFGLFVLQPDDPLVVEGEQKRAVRDNVIFELGMFIGRLGRRRAFILVPRGVNDLHLPSDLKGLTPAEYDPDRSIPAQVAVGPACTGVRRAVKRVLDDARNAKGVA